MSKMNLPVCVQRQFPNVTLCIKRLTSTFRYDDLQVTLTPKPAKKPECEDTPFGSHLADHMFEVNWSKDTGWDRPHIKPVAPFELSPSAKVFHFSCELFDSLKAYRGVDKKVRLFRPMENLTRMAVTAERSALPTFDQCELLRCLKKLISIDQEWVPYSLQSTLYIRPTLMGTEACLGLTEPKEAKLYIVSSPVSSYFPKGLSSVSLLADPTFVRAWPGGCGSYKMGSNYGPTIAVSKMAREKYNCQQVLWLYGDDHQMTEIGTMNLFVFWINGIGEEELVTPPIESGLILPGVMRKSVLELAKEWDEFHVSENVITMGMFIKALKEGRVKDFFGVGTSCTVCPVSRILYRGEELILPKEGSTVGLTRRMYRELDDIHRFRSPHPWMEEIDDPDHNPSNPFCSRLHPGFHIC